MLGPICFFRPPPCGEPLHPQQRRAHERGAQNDADGRPHADRAAHLDEDGDLDQRNGDEGEEEEGGQDRLSALSRVYGRIFALAGRIGIARGALTMKIGCGRPLAHMAQVAKSRPMP